MLVRPFTRKLPAHHGVFSYARIPGHETTGTPAGVTYRLFRRDQAGALHAETRDFHPDCTRRFIASELNIARHQLRNTVDEIDLALMGVV